MIARLAAIALGGILLLWTTVWNGYPFLAADSAGYLFHAFEGGFEPRRPGFYPPFVALFSLHRSLWPVVAVQCLIASFVIHALAEHTGGLRARPAFLAGLLVSAGLTSLPWFTGRLMPDLFAGLLGILVYLLVFACERRPGKETAGLLWLLAAFATLSHVANIAIVGLNLVLGLGFHLAARRGQTAAVMRRAAVMLVIAGGAAGAVAAGNWSAAGTFALTNEAHAFTMARLVRYGVIQRLLAEHCSEQPYALCPYQDALSTAPDHYMFSPNSPLNHIGGVHDSAAASAAMIADANRYYLGMQAAAALRASLEQIGLVRLGMGLHSNTRFGLLGPPTMLNRYLPQEYQAYLGGRQDTDRLHVDSFNQIVVPVAWIGITLALIQTILGILHRIAHPALDACAFLLLWVTTNAIIMGVLNAPFDRYQSRVAWLLPLAATVALVAIPWRLRRERTQIER